MLIAAAIASMHIGLTSLLTRHYQPKTPAVTCGVTTVSHIFVGKPGTTFRYDGDQYQIPPTGRIELIGVKGVNTYEVNGRALPLNLFPRDEFGAETVLLP